MLTVLLLDLFDILTGLGFSIIPRVDLGDIPILGNYIRDILIFIMGYWNSFMETLPYLIVVWQMFIYVIIPFEIGLLILKFFLASRVPANA